MAIDATIGGAGSNSYVTLAEAQEYFAGRLHCGAWAGASEGDRERALLTACRHLERERYWDGDEGASGTQALTFPRRRDRDEVGALVIPQPVKDAQCEEALALLARGAESERRRALQAAGVTSFSVDGLSEQYAPGAAQQVIESAEARALLSPLVCRGGVIATSERRAGELTAGSG